MKKVTKEYLEEYVQDVGESEKRHYKYSSFYITIEHTITQEDVDKMAKWGDDASDFLNVRVTKSGMWDYNDGTEWDSTEYTKVESYQEFVPEVVIPEHYVTKYKYTTFEPVWE